MKLQSSDLIVSSDEHRVTSAHAQERQLAKIAPTVYCQSGKLLSPGRPWVTRIRVAEARILATQHLLTHRRRLPEDASAFAFTGESALIALGVQPWWNNPDVTFRTTSRTGKATVRPAARIGEQRIPEVLVRQVNWGKAGTTVVKKDHLGQRLMDLALTVGASGDPVVVSVAEPHLILYDLCRLQHPLQAFHDASLLLRHLSNWDTRDLTGSLQRETWVREALAANLEHVGSAPGIRRAKAILAIAQPALESPGESAVAWTLLGMLSDKALLEAQVPVNVKGQRFRIDLSLPSANVALEVTGRGKFGQDPQSAHFVADRFVARQQILEASGWKVHNVTYEQAKQLIPLQKTLRALLSECGVKTRSFDPLLWAPPGGALMSRERRY